MEQAELALLQAFVQAFQASTDSHLVEQREEIAFAEHRRERLDALLTFALPDNGAVFELAVEAVNAAYPRDARRLIEYLATFHELHEPSGSKPAIPVVVAHHLTDGAKDAFRAAGINYFEASSGSLRFRDGTWFIDIERPSKSSAGRKVGNVFSGAREQVVHALLMHWLRADEDDWLPGNELAVMADTSPFTVSKTLQELEKYDWVETTGAGPTLRRRLKRGRALLDAWANEWTHRAHTEPRTRWYTYAGGKGGIVDWMLEKLADRTGWAVTGAAAANAQVPHLTTVDRVQIIVPRGLGEAWAQDLRLERTDKGSNVTLIERAGASLMFLDEHPARPDSRFASPFIQYLDLLDGVGRNKELATEFRSRVLRMGSIADD